MPSQKRVLYCHCVHARVLPPAVKQSVLRSLCESGHSFTAVPDLCRLAAGRAPLLKDLAAGNALQIAACYPRAVQWLFAAAEAPLHPESVEILNLRVESPEQAAGQIRTIEESSASEEANADLVLLEGSRAGALAPEERFHLLNALLEKGYAVECMREKKEVANRVPTLIVREAPRPVQEVRKMRFIEIQGVEVAHILDLVDKARIELALTPPPTWLPWFPVIDYERCTQCMQCLSFCLFGVFGLNAERKIAVEQPEQCKTNCPACSRVCPEAAIIFPQYATGPINGEAINAAALEREKMKIDVSALLGGDVYQMLRDRSERARSRFSKERDADKALQERQRCVARLLQGANIPPEVLRALPSAEEIQRRAAEALAKAKGALEKPDSPSN